MREPVPKNIATGCSLHLRPARLDLNQSPGRFCVFDRCAALQDNGWSTTRQRGMNRRESVFLARGPTLNAVLSSLAAYLAAGVRPPTPMAKAIVLVLVVKLIAIACAGIFLFSSDERLVVDPNAVSRLIGPSVSSANEGRH
jgi:hypothetical protein